MPPLRSHEGAFYSHRGDDDFPDLVGRSLAGELTAVAVDQPEAGRTYLFAPPADHLSAGALASSAMLEGALAPELTMGRTVIYGGEVIDSEVMNDITGLTGE